jgi:DnaJ-class molecular chaperone
MDIEECEVCEGSGEFDGDTCPECDGTGEVSQFD